MLPWLVALLPVDDPASDPLLAKKLTVEERYLDLTEFAARVTRATKVPIKLSDPVKGRKITLFAPNQTVAESMTMVANALGAHWTRIGPDWNLRPDNDVAREEELATYAQSVVRRRMVEDWVTHFGEKIRPQSSLIEVRTAELLKRVDAGIAVEKLVSGQPILGSPSGKFGSARVALDGIFGGKKVAVDPVLAVFMDPGTGQISAVVRDLVNGNRASNTGPLNYGDWSQDTMSVKERQAAWGEELDRDLANTKLDDTEVELPKYLVDSLSLGDILQQIYRRTHVPVAAETFRIGMTSRKVIKGKTIREVLNSIDDGNSARKTVGRRLVWRTEKGWLLARHWQAWSLRPGEIAEARLAPLEKKEVSLNDLASLASSLNSDQRQSLSLIRPLATFPTIGLFESYLPLVIYDALPSNLRNQATKGIPFEALPSLARQRWNENAFLRWFRRGTKEEVSALLSGRPPDGAGLLVLPQLGKTATIRDGEEAEGNFDVVRMSLDLSGASLPYTVPVGRAKP